MHMLIRKLRPGWPFRLFFLGVLPSAVFCLFGLFCWAPPALSECIDISDIPMDTQLQAAPASVMFVVDDSGSMDWEFMTEEADGIFHGEYFNFAMSDNAYSNDYYVVEGSEKRLWKARWSGYNRMYYNPAVDYDPWPGFSNASTTAPRSNPVNADPTLDLSGEFDSLESGVVVDNVDAGFSKSDNGWDDYYYPAEQYGDNYYYTYNNDGTAWAKWTVDLPAPGNYEVFGWWRSHTSRVTDVTYDIYHNGLLTTNVPPGGVNHNVGNQWTSLGTYYFSGNGNEYVLLNATVPGTSKYSADAIKFTPVGSSAISIKNAHYYTFSESENVPYLIVLDGSIKYYRFTNNVDSIDQAGLVLNTSPPADVIPRKEDGTVRAYSEELQNFANWFSFYRKRELTAKAAISKIIDGIEGVKVGFYSIHNRLNQPVLPVKVTEDGTFQDETSTLLDLLYNDFNSSGWTPLREAVKDVGDYFDQAGGTGGIGDSPYAAEADGGACQQSFAIVMTDGYWNGYVSGIGNEDGTEGAPYADSYSATLADVAMKYYKTDLSSTLDDLVPTNYPDLATWQHMVTYGISFGVNGTLDPDDYDLYNSDPSQRVYPDWPNPHYDPEERKIDDLWHAAVNGRGNYLSASNPEELIESLQALMDNVMARVGSGASVSINGEELHAGSTIYQASYSTDNWTGDVKAYPLNQSSGAVMRDNPLWSAGELLDDKSSDERIVATYNTETSAGVPFRFNSLSDAQKAQLDPDPATAEEILNYLRGDTSKEEANGGSFRNRTSKLGDIVHSSPVYFDGVIFVGGNDGMLHAVNAQNGQEVFAYVPGLVFENLAQLSDPSYSHRFYVDLTPYAADTGSSSLLVGGLGKGGKGYYCLDVTSAASVSSEGDLAARVKWEYSDSADLGYTFSEAYIVKANNDNWVVIFGNGYESANGHAVLFVLNASDGSLLKKIDTGAGSCNGLSTPVVIDVNMDDKVDYVYAGDLKGNLWKFDFTGADPANWGVAYGTDGSPQPLFRARDASGNTQPITTRPDVMFHCDPMMPGYMVVFGTGKYLGNADFVDDSVQTIYGIWDYGTGSTEYLGTFNRGSNPELSNQPETVTLVEQTEIYYGQPTGSIHSLRVLSQNTPTWVDPGEWASWSGTGDGTNPNAGWYFDLPISKERVVRNLMIRDGKVIVISSVPKDTPCAAGGDSIFMEMDACSGGRLGLVQLDINDDEIIDEDDMISIPDPNDPEKEILVAPTGIHYPVMMYPPKILRMPDDTERKYSSTAAGNIVMLRERGEKQGIYYWRVVE